MNHPWKILFKVQRFSAHFYFTIIYESAVLTQIFMYCWFGNEVEIKVSVRLQLREYESSLNPEQQYSVRCLRSGLGEYRSRVQERSASLDCEESKTYQVVRDEFVLP
jgi:hypothetical protein